MFQGRRVSAGDGEEHGPEGAVKDQPAKVAQSNVTGACKQTANTCVPWSNVTGAYKHVGNTYVPWRLILSHCILAQKEVTGVMSERRVLLLLALTRGEAKGGVLLTVQERGHGKC